MEKIIRKWNGVNAISIASCIEDPTGASEKYTSCVDNRQWTISFTPTASWHVINVAKLMRRINNGIIFICQSEN